MRKGSEQRAFVDQGRFGVAGAWNPGARKNWEKLSFSFVFLVPMGPGYFWLADHRLGPTGLSSFSWSTPVGS